MITVDLQTSF